MKTEISRIRAGKTVIINDLQQGKQIYLNVMVLVRLRNFAGNNQAHIECN